MSNEEVIELVKKSLEDKNHFKYIIDFYEERIINYCNKIVGNREDAKECAQDVFIKVFFSLKKFDINYPFNPWLYKISYNTCITFLKKKKIIYSIDYERSVSEENDPTLGVEREEKYNVVRKALGKIDEKYRKVIDLYYMKELSYEEISVRLNLNLNTVRTHLKRGKIQLRKYL